MIREGGAGRAGGGGGGMGCARTHADEPGPPKRFPAVFPPWAAGRSCPGRLTDECWFGFLRFFLRAASWRSPRLFEAGGLSGSAGGAARRGAGMARGPAWRRALGLAGALALGAHGAGAWRAGGPPGQGLAWVPLPRPTTMPGATSAPAGPRRAGGGGGAGAGAGGGVGWQQLGSQAKGAPSRWR